MRCHNYYSNGHKFKKTVATIILSVNLATISMLNLTSVAYADTKTLAEVTSTTAATTEASTEANNKSESSDTPSKTKTEKGSSFGKSLANVADVSGYEIPDTGIIKSIKKGCATAFNYLMVAVAGGALVMAGIDLIAIVVVPLRPLLTGGNKGTPVTGNQQQQQGGFGGGFNSGFGGGGFGSGFGGGFGGGGFGGGDLMGGRGQQSQGGKQWVSNSCLNVIATQQGIFKALKAYLAEFSLTVIMIGLIGLLAASGIWVKVGLAVGGLIIDLVSSMISGLI